MTLQLPDEIQPGEHRVVVLLNGTDFAEPTPPDETAPPTSDEQLVWEQGILVFTGQLPTDFDVARFIEEERDDRLRAVSGEDRE